jgi:hypothetical protein
VGDRVGAGDDTVEVVGQELDAGHKVLLVEFASRTGVK